MKPYLLTAMAAALLIEMTPAAAVAQTILFVGNSYTYGHGSPVMGFHPERVKDLNGEGIGGVPALFKTFAQQSGQEWEVALETSPAKTLHWHLTEKRSTFGRPWDVVVLQGQSTLDPLDPGNPARHITAASEIGKLVRGANRSARLLLMATWSSARMVYQPNPPQLKPSPWFGKPVYTMAADLQRASELALKDKAVTAVLPVGLAWNRAMRNGVADPNPYDGLEFGKVSLWNWDYHHASTEGYYLEALVVFGAITGVDPVSLGPQERAAIELGMNPTVAVELQKIAKAELDSR